MRFVAHTLILSELIKPDIGISSSKSTGRPEPSTDHYPLGDSQNLVRALLTEWIDTYFIVW